MTDEGLVGIGETDLNAWIARACIEAPGTHTMDRGLRPLLIGRDPLDPSRRSGSELYVGTAMTGRRGARRQRDRRARHRALGHLRQGRGRAVLAALGERGARRR